MWNSVTIPPRISHLSPDCKLPNIDQKKNRVYDFKNIELYSNLKWFEVIYWCRRNVLSSFFGATTYGWRWPLIFTFKMNKRKKKKLWMS